VVSIFAFVFIKLFGVVAPGAEDDERRLR
jgi:hypothetical protein